MDLDAPGVRDFGDALFRFTHSARQRGTTTGKITLHAIEAGFEGKIIVATEPI